jgi:hypothetical protein
LVKGWIATVFGKALSLSHFNYQMGQMCSGSERNHFDESRKEALYGKEKTSSCGHRTYRDNLAYTSTGSEEAQNPGWFQSVIRFDYGNSSSFISTTSENSFGGDSSGGIIPSNRTMNKQELTEACEEVTHVKRARR